MACIVGNTIPLAVFTKGVMSPSCETDADALGKCGVAGEWTEVKIPLKSLTPSHHGDALDALL